MAATFMANIAASIDSAKKLIVRMPTVQSISILNMTTQFFLFLKNYYDSNLSIKMIVPPMAKPITNTYSLMNALLLSFFSLSVLKSRLIFESNPV